MTPSGTSTSEKKKIAKDHFAYMISRRSDTVKNRVWHIILDIHGRGLKAKVDTGATCNSLPLQAYKVLCEDHSEQTATRLTAYGGTQRTVRGKTTLETSFEGVTRKMEFTVVLSKKPLNKVSPRIQRMRLHCLRYHYLEYRRGRDMALAEP